jgi:hypothetical protein
MVLTRLPATETPCVKTRMRVTSERWENNHLYLLGWEGVLTGTTDRVFLPLSQAKRDLTIGRTYVVYTDGKDDDDTFVSQFGPNE